ncbi:unnamed protein product [Rotaria sordida]|uniref:Uncharacterized protein n=1 Tax=Rotaria sordida TaxID=392033 RepID=A0A816CS24_9BILA|nr:unnamed protein product [Rotaria sordida]CAF1626193.1 unnamed protein product [Rotaria sordida]
MLGMGNSKSWSEILENFTGENKLESQAILDFFQPLYNWLKMENLSRESSTLNIDSNKNDLNEHDTHLNDLIEKSNEKMHKTLKKILTRCIGVTDGICVIDVMGVTCVTTDAIGHGHSEHI